MSHFFNKIRAILVWNDAELNASSNQYRLNLKLYQKILHFGLILDKYGLNENPLPFNRYSTSKWLVVLISLLKFITKRIATFFCKGSPIKWLEIFCESNWPLMRPCPFYPYIYFNAPFRSRFAKWQFFVRETIFSVVLFCIMKYFWCSFVWNLVFLHNMCGRGELPSILLQIKLVFVNYFHVI